jgi:ATP-binding cassette, subfamily C, bacterial CydD
VAERLLDLIDQGEARRVVAVAPPSARDVPVRLERVGFAYPNRPKTVLRGADLELWPGEIVALTGSSGAGKSTVASLLLGLAAPARGRVRLGAVDLADCDLDAWHARVAWVPQNPTLFRLPVRDNIRLGVPDAPDDRVRAAAQAAAADAFIQRLPDGYDTVVGDGGRQLSAGERQRLAVARALIQDADLVVLDEPTANLNPVSAAAVCESLRHYLAGRTALLITHHPNVVSLADRVVRLAAGRIVDEVVALEAAP